MRLAHAGYMRFRSRSPRRSRAVQVDGFASVGEGATCSPPVNCSEVCAGVAQFGRATDS